MWFARRWSEFQMWWIVCWRIPLDIRCILATYFLSSSITGVFWGINHRLGASSPSTATAAKDTTGALAIWTSQTFQFSLMVELSGLHGRGRKRVKAEVEEVQVHESQLPIDLINSWWTDPHELMKRCNHQWCLIKQRFRRRQGEDFCDFLRLGHQSLQAHAQLSRRYFLSWTRCGGMHGESVFQLVWIESVKLGAFWRWPMRMKTCFLVACWLRGVVHVDDDIFQKSSN